MAGSFCTVVKSVLRWSAGARPVRQPDEVAAEEPLEIQIDTHPVSVTMRTPGHDDELAAGFLLSEGLIRRRLDLLKIAPHPRHSEGNVINLFLAPGIRVDFAQLTRHVFASSSCGLCGKATIAAVHRRFKPVRAKLTLRAATLSGLPKKLREFQETFERTGGLHAAGMFDLGGKLLILREDIGRHNAVDKVLGHGLLQDLLPFDWHVLMVSGRISFEIVQKALAARVPVVAAVSAPSSLAVEFARRSGQTLVGFLREDRMNIYANPRCIRFD